jgi:glycine/D-amino acid oxidase-like deaminating enzyme
MPPAASLYAQTAPASGDYAPLAGEARTDVAVIGGGIAGLSCALHLAEQGKTVTVLEAHEIGWGASGRNGGQVNPGLKLAPSALKAAYGKEQSERLIALGACAPDLLFDLVARHSIACEASRNGTLRAAKSVRQSTAIKVLAEDDAAHGAPVRYLTANEVAAMTGTACYQGAVFDPRGGAINPLAYTRSLAAAAAGAGANIHTDSAVFSITREPGGWRLSTRHGTLIADHVALCANAYQSGLVPGLAQSQVPVYSMIAATAALPDEIRRQIMPSGAVLYEQADITIYYRIDAHGRLLIGGRSPSREISVTDTFFLRRYALDLWPALQGAGWEYQWNGQLAITTDHMPHFHEPAPGLTAILGCNGRGVALMTALGRNLALRIGSDDTQEMTPLPTAISKIPFHQFWKLGVALRLAQGRMMDRLRP